MPRAASPVRGAPVVRAVIDATLEELARVGYGALTFEEVAARAGVNKTTVYRRWPSKPDLVKAALAAAAEAVPPLEETGAVRADLLAIARRTRDRMVSRQGRGLVRTLLGGSVDPDILALAAVLRGEVNAPARRILERARDRGDLREDCDPDLLLGAIAGWIIHVVFRQGEAADDARLARMVDLLLEGAVSPARTSAGTVRSRGGTRFDVAGPAGRRRSATR